MWRSIPGKTQETCRTVDREVLAQRKIGDTFIQGDDAEINDVSIQ